MDECHKLLTNKVDLVNPEGHQILRNIYEPLPLGGPPGQVTIQPQFFFNKDLDYLLTGDKERKIALSISKLKAARYLDFGLEELVPSLWVESERDYDISAAYGITHWWFRRKEFYINKHSEPSDREAVRSQMRILSVISVKVFEKYGYNYLREIILRRADYKEYKISEKDFKNLHPNDFEDMFLLNIQEKLNHLPKTDKTSFHMAVNMWIRNLDATDYYFKEDYTIVPKPRAVVYRDKNDQRKLMRLNELHKFSDGTLTRVMEKLDHMVKDFHLFEYNKGMDTKKWLEDDKRRSKDFITAIEKRLQIRRIFRSLESFDTYPILLSFTHCGNKSILRVLRIILVILPEHPSETKVLHNEDGNPARANIKQALGSYERPHKGVKASANSDIVYFFTSAQDGDPLQDDVRLCLGDDLKKAQDHNQRQVKDESKDHYPKYITNQCESEQALDVSPGPVPQFQMMFDSAESLRFFMAMMSVHISSGTRNSEFAFIDDKLYIVAGSHNGSYLSDFQNQVPFTLEQQWRITSMLNTLVYNAMSQNISRHNRPSPIVVAARTHEVSPSSMLKRRCKDLALCDGWGACLLSFAISTFPVKIVIRSQNLQVQVKEVKSVNKSLNLSVEELSKARALVEVTLRERDEMISAQCKKIRLLEEQSEIFHEISNQEMKQQIILFEEDKRMFLAKNEFMEKVSYSVQKEYSDLLASNDVLKQRFETKFKFSNTSLEKMIEMIEEENESNVSKISITCSMLEAKNLELVKEMGELKKCFDEEKKVFENKISNLEKDLAQRVKDFDDFKTELSRKTNKFETYLQILKKKMLY
ncbi:hypothetical protein Tco_1450038 [Tanacetum coccineum]